MIVIALTGGIGSGKTTVSHLFAELGVPIIDTDIIARELVAPGQTALKELKTQFGLAYFNADGTLNRQKLRQQIFAEPEKRKQLEAILHPRIYLQVTQRLSALDKPKPYCIVVIPLLTKTSYRDLIDRILVIDIPEEIQIKRTMARDNCSEADARSIIKTQTTRDARLAMADDIIENTGDLAHLKQKVLTLHQYYVNLASATKI